MALKVELLEESFRELAPRGEEFVEAFYERLFDMFPEIQYLFKDTDMEAQRKKLLGALVMVIENLKKTEILGPALQELGKRHEDKGVQREHYPMVGVSLLKTFEDFLGDKWTLEVREAWAEAYDGIVGLMYSGYKVTKDAA